MAVECSGDQAFCGDEMTVEWYGHGNQYTTLKRGCLAQPAKDTCDFAESSRIKVNWQLIYD